MPVAHESYTRSLSTFRERFNSLYEDRQNITKELISLARTIQELATLCGEEPDIPSLGADTSPNWILINAWLGCMPFAEAIRTALRIIYPTAFTTPELREFLARVGYPLENRTDPMISLNVALKRMADAGEVVVVPKDGVRKAYQWAFKNEHPPAESLNYEGLQTLIQHVSQNGTVIGELTAQEQIENEQEATIPKRVSNLLRQNPEVAYCDDCLATVLGLPRRQQAQRVTAALAVTQEFIRQHGVCGECGGNKFVTRANQDNLK